MAIEDAEYYRRKLEDSDKKNSDLREFQSLVRDVIEKLYYAILWAWIIMGIAAPVGIYYRPLPQDSFLQALTIGGIFWLLFAMAHGMKAIGSLKR